MEKKSFLAVISIILVFFSCSPAKDDGKSAAGISGYVVKPGVLYLISGSGKGFAGTVDADAQGKPWAVASLVSGMAVSGNTVFIGINRTGGAFLSTQGGILRYLPVAGGEPFRQRTIGSVFSYKGRFWCQLYWNSFFDAPLTSGKRVSLVSIAEGEPAFRTEHLPFEAEFDSSWEVTGLFAAVSGVWVGELKKTDSERTEFRYVSFSLGKPEWKEIPRTSFDDALNRGSLAADFPALAGMLTEIEDVPSGSVMVARKETTPEFSVFELSDGEEGSVLKGFSGSGGNVLAGSESGVFSKNGGISLPFSLSDSAPEGAEITEAVALAGMVVIAWETGNFPYTSSAGFAVIDPEGASARIPAVSGNESEKIAGN